MNTKRRRRPNEKSLEFLQIEESAVYQQLLATERKLDTILVRKRLDIQEALSRQTKAKATLRVFVSNTAVASDDGPSAWTLKVEGRLLDGKVGSAGRKFSSFIKSLIVELPKDLYGEDQHLVEWKKEPSTPDCDGFEIKRTAEENVPVKIIMQLDYAPEKYRLAPALAHLLRIHTETKASVIMTLWQYIKANRLQDANEHSVIRCDEALQQLFEVDSFSFPQIPELIMRYLQPTEPISFDYVIRVDQERTVADVVLDIEVDIEDPSRQQMSKFVTNANAQREIAALDSQIIQLIQKIRAHKLKRDFMISFCKQPADFIRQWVNAQSRDLETVLGDVHVNTELMRRSQFYREPWVAEAVVQYLANGRRRV